LSFPATIAAARSSRNCSKPATSPTAKTSRTGS
jgi:hypothetical protein